MKPDSIPHTLLSTSPPSSFARTAAREASCSTVYRSRLAFLLIASLGGTPIYSVAVERDVKHQAV